MFIVLKNPETSHFKSEDILSLNSLPTCHNTKNEFTFGETYLESWKQHKRESLIEFFV